MIFFERKQIIEDMEAEMSKALNIYIYIDNLAVAEEEHFDEDITTEAKSRNYIYIDLKEAQKKQAYKETMNIYIENINGFENRKKVFYKVMEPELF